jgi:para-aminobenzoate N-oxygenase AurF
VRSAEPSASSYQDPLARIDWSGIDRECWWLPPQALSLAGIPEFEALPLEARRRLSHYEYAHLLDIGLWLEAVFVERLAQLARRTGDFERRARYLREIREEAGHSLMFVELIRRSGVGLPSARTGGLRIAEALGRWVPSGSALFWAMVVIGEELPDRLTRRLRHGVEDVTLSAVVYRMAQLHGLDEASHAFYARERCEEATLRLGRRQRALLSPILSRILDAFAGWVYFPPLAVYGCVGLSPAAQWRARALRNPTRRDQAGAMLRPTLEFLRRTGWRVSSRYG